MIDSYSPSLLPEQSNRHLSNSIRDSEPDNTTSGCTVTASTPYARKHSFTTVARSRKLGIEDGERTTCTVARVFSWFRLQIWRLCVERIWGIYTHYISARIDVSCFNGDTRHTFSKSCFTSLNSTPEGTLSSRIRPERYTIHISL